jgi:AraC family transcriptional regulator
VKTLLGSIPEIKKTAARLIVGQCIETHLAENRITALWQSFAPRIKEVHHRLSTGSFSVQVYDHDFMKELFTPFTVFEKWAGVEVSIASDIPLNMKVLHIPAGRWAVFTYKGTANDFHVFAQYMYETWLPKSGEQLDDRPHFEQMPREYLGQGHPDAEEYVWIPIK